jgi:hypothetical protein
MSVLFVKVLNKILLLHNYYTRLHCSSNAILIKQSFFCHNICGASDITIDPYSVGLCYYLYRDFLNFLMETN